MRQMLQAATGTTLIRSELVSLTEILGDVAEAELALLYLVGQAEPVLHCKAVSSHHRGSLSCDGLTIEGMAAKVDLGNAIVGQVVVQNIPLIHHAALELASSSNGKPWFTPGVDAPADFPFCSLLAVPLPAWRAPPAPDGPPLGASGPSLHVSGVLLFVNKRKAGGSFSSDDAELLQQAGALVATHLEASAALAGQAAQGDRMRRLLQLAQQVALPSFQARDETFETLIRLAREVVDAKVVAIYGAAHPPEARLRMLQLAVDSSCCELREGVELQQEEALFGQGLVGLCAISQEALTATLSKGVTIEASNPDGHFDPSIDAPTGIDPKAVLCVTMTTPETQQCLGVLTVYDKQGPFGVVKGFSKEDAHLLEMVASILGSVIHRSLTATSQPKPAFLNGFSVPDIV